MPRVAILTLENKSLLDDFFCIDSVKSVFKDYIEVFGDDYTFLSPLPELEKKLKKFKNFKSVSCEFCAPGKIIDGTIYKVSYEDSVMLSTMTVVHNDRCELKENAVLYNVDLDFKSFIIHLMLLYKFSNLEHVDNFFEI